MPQLTKIQYDMLADDAKQKINVQIANAGVGSPFVFDQNTSNGTTTETLTGYKVTTDGNTTVEGIRSTAITGNQLVITLATFTPTLSAAGAPSANLNWDEAATGFTVNAINPNDYTSKWISSVDAITAGTNITTTLGSYTAGAKSATPAGGIDWYQTFSTNGSASIKSASTNATGGSASGTLSFKYADSTGEHSYTDATAGFTVNWATPTHSISLSGLSGKTFLDLYTSASYTPSITGIANAGNKTYTITGTNGSVSSSSGAGTLTFATAINKTNASSTTTKVSLSTVISRPAGVANTTYTANLSSVDSASINTTASFTYPSFWLWTSGSGTVPDNAACVTGNGFDSNVTVLGDQVHAFAGTVTNSAGSPKAFWFAVRASATQPTTFKTGSGPSLLVDVAHTTSSVGLHPDNAPAGYANETYNLYGIVLQAGNTYVSIG
jgi:hypothetical protein